MKINLPSLINDEPTAQGLRAMGFKRNLHHRIATETARNIWLRTRLAEAQNWKCAWCGCKTTHIRNRHNSFTIEHVQPRSLGGTDCWDNLAMACATCNSKRGTKSIDTFMDELSDPNKPNKPIPSRARSKSKKRLKGYLKRIENMIDRGRDIDIWIHTLRLTLEDRSIMFAAKQELNSCHIA